MLRVAGANKFFVLWASVWTAFVVVVLVLVGQKVYGQWKTRDYVETHGVITSSDVDQHVDESTTYSLKVNYTYSVDGRAFTGSVLKHDASGSSDRSYFEALHTKFARGATVPVYFDPDSPTRAVLIRGQAECFILIFLMPFIGIALLCWIQAWQTLRFRCSDAPAAALPLSRRGSVQRIRLADQTWLWVGLTWIIASVIAVVLGFAVTGVHETAGLNLGLFSMQLTAAPAIYFWVRSREPLLVLDADRRQLELHSGGREVARCSYDAVASLWVNEKSEPNSDGGSMTRYAPTFAVRAGGEVQRIELGLLSDAARATAFREWLAAQLSSAPIPSNPLPKKPAYVRAPEQRARELGLPREWRVRSGRVVDWLAVAFLSLFAVPALCLALLCALAGLTGVLSLQSWLVLSVTAIGLLTVRPWWRRIRTLAKPFDSVVWLDGSGLGWDAERRAQDLPSPPDPSTPRRGYAPFSRIALVRHGCGAMRDEIDLQLKAGPCITLPRRVTAGYAGRELIELLSNDFPEVTVVKCTDGDRRR